MKIYSHAPAPKLRGHIHTVDQGHCFVCHCGILAGTMTHARHHEVLGETTLTARSAEEHGAMRDFLMIMVGDRRTVDASITFVDEGESK